MMFGIATDSFVLVERGRFKHPSALHHRKTSAAAKFSNHPRRWLFENWEHPLASFAEVVFRPTGTGWIAPRRLALSCADWLFRFAGWTARRRLANSVLLDANHR